MPKGYVILAEISKDPEGMKVPGGLSPGGLAGDEAGRLEFDSVDSARDWCKFEAYQKTAELRQAAANRKAAAISGFVEVQAF
jgi:hypothetical protein